MAAYQDHAPGVRRAGRLQQALVLEEGAPVPPGAPPAVQLDGMGWDGRPANLDLLELAAQAFARQAGLPAAYAARHTCSMAARGGAVPGRWLPGCWLAAARVRSHLLPAGGSDLATCLGVAGDVLEQGSRGLSCQAAAQRYGVGTCTCWCCTGRTWSRVFKTVGVVPHTEGALPRVCGTALGRFAMLAGGLGACITCEHLCHSVQDVAAAHGYGGGQPWAADLATLLRSCMRQAYGWPGGAHAAFQQAGVDAITMRVMLAKHEVRLAAVFNVSEALAVSACTRASGCAVMKQVMLAARALSVNDVSCEPDVVQYGMPRCLCNGLKAACHGILAYPVVQVCCNGAAGTCWH